MRLVSFEYQSKKYSGILQDDVIKELSNGFYDELELSGKEFLLGDVKLLPPVLPNQLILVGLNYVAHAGEFDNDVPQEPIIWMASSSAIIGPEDKIIIKNPMHRTDHEGELVVIIGRECQRVSEEEALNYVLGYTCGNDISDRHIQKRDGQWCRAKSFSTYKPLGPWIETELNPAKISVICRVNGEIKQTANTEIMVFSVAKLISFVSQVMTLKPGDAIMTGTPAGVGPIKPGDTVEVEIEGIGILSNIVD